MKKVFLIVYLIFVLIAGYGQDIRELLETEKYSEAKKILNKSNINNISENGETPLQQALWFNAPDDFILFLLNTGANPNPELKTYTSIADLPLILGCKRLSIIQMLVEKRGQE